MKFITNFVFIFNEFLGTFLLWGGLDAGYFCQNLYLACEAINAGTSAIAAYDQEELDELLGLDGEEEFSIYLALVGKVKNGDRIKRPFLTLGTKKGIVKIEK